MKGPSSISRGEEGSGGHALGSRSPWSRGRRESRWSSASLTAPEGLGPSERSLSSRTSIVRRRRGQGQNLRGAARLRADGWPQTGGANAKPSKSAAKAASRERTSPARSRDRRERGCGENRTRPRACLANGRGKSSLRMSLGPAGPLEQAPCFRVLLARISPSCRRLLVLQDHGSLRSSPPWASFGPPSPYHAD